MFALKKIKGSLTFYVLIKNKINQYESVLEQLKNEGNYDSELNTLQARLQQMAELH